MTTHEFNRIWVDETATVLAKTVKNALTFPNSSFLNSWPKALDAREAEKCSSSVCQGRILVNTHSFYHSLPTGSLESCLHYTQPILHPVASIIFIIHHSMDYVIPLVKHLHCSLFLSCSTWGLLSKLILSQSLPCTLSYIIICFYTFPLCVSTGFFPFVWKTLLFVSTRGAPLIHQNPVKPSGLPRLSVLLPSVIHALSISVSFYVVATNHMWLLCRWNVSSATGWKDILDLLS